MKYELVAVATALWLLSIAVFAGAVAMGVFIA